MSSFEHTRVKIVSPDQHPLKHSLSDFGFGHASLPSEIADVQSTLNYILAVLYPRTKGTVATPGDLPAAGNTAGDYYTVQDDGDGKYAGYTWVKYDGMADYDWRKTADVDWGIDGVISGLLDRTQRLYAIKLGTTDYDTDTGLALTGDEAGQHIYGGDIANQHLTLHPNNGDDVGFNTGFIQLAGDCRPTEDLAFTLGTATKRFSAGYFGQIVVGTNTLTVTSDELGTVFTDGAKKVSFVDSDVSTTGDVSADVLYATASLTVQSGTEIGDDRVILDWTGLITTEEFFSLNSAKLTGITNAAIGGTMLIATGSITDSTGEISFGNENLTTTGSVTGASFSSTGAAGFGSLTIDNIFINNSTITTTVGDLTLNAFKAIPEDVSTIHCDSDVFDANEITATKLTVDNVSVDGAAINSTTAVITTNSSLKPSIATLDLGDGTDRWRSLYLSGNISNGTNSISIGEALSLRNVLFKDAARTTPIGNGDAILYDSASGTFLATTLPSGDHTGLLNINGGANGDGGHSVFPKLDGRTGGQTISGGTATAELLQLRNNAVDGVGINLGATKIEPTADNTIDLGSSSAAFKDLYVDGQSYGLRTQNVTTATMPAAGNTGRQVFNTDSDILFIDNGAAFIQVGSKSYRATKTNVELGSAIDVSGSVDDARNCIWQLADESNHEVLAVVITKTQTHVTISTDIDLPAGNYRLMGIEV